MGVRETATASARPAGSASPAALPPSGSLAPAKLQAVAAEFGMTMNAEWEWTETDRMRTRFDWTGRPVGGAHETRWSFWVKGDEMRQMRPFLPQVVQSAALNLTRTNACEPFDQPPDLARLMGADRVITVCFEPAPHVAEGLRYGVLHGLVRGDVLVIVVVLANDRTGTIPLSEHIGGRFEP